MEVVSYYGEDSGSHFPFWQTHIGEALAREISENAVLNIIRDQNYQVDKKYDIAYCQTYAVPKTRPADFIYTFLSDCIGYEKMIKNWISSVRPNLICMLQDMPGDLIDFADRHGCIVELMPWFVCNNPEYREKDVEGMCSGCLNPKHYPRRRAIYNYLAEKKFDGVVLSGSSEFGHYRLSNEEYVDTIGRSKYYLSGGIYDNLIPPKYYEACNWGCAMISHEMSFMEKCGFVDGETYIKIVELSDIDNILYTDRYLEIGKNAKKMVQERHTVKERARQILEIYENG
jgi:hypothetical protein